MEPKRSGSSRYLFAHTQVNRIEGETEITNIGEQRAWKKAGFRPEGALRCHLPARQWRDRVIYSLLRPEVDLNLE